MSKGLKSEVFVDWFAATQFHPKGGLPLFTSGLSLQADSGGHFFAERGKSAPVAGSYETAVRIFCDGARVVLSGNVGRFNRPDNVFGFGFWEVFHRANRILQSVGLPPFSFNDDCGASNTGRFSDGRNMPRGGCTISRLDLTTNYRAGSLAQARAVMRSLSSRSIKRARKGMSGDESVWFSNSRSMVKAYRKGHEMRVHGGDAMICDWADEEGLVRFEVELKARELSDLGLSHPLDITDDKLAAVFNERTAPFRQIDSSDEPDVLANIPQRSRAYAAAWLGGQDCRLLCSQATLYRHAKVLREYGLDILEVRNIQQFPTKVRVIDLEPLAVPDWYLKREVA